MTGVTRAPIPLGNPARVTIRASVYSCRLMVLLSMMAVGSRTSGADVRFEPGDTQLEIWVGDNHFATYVYREPMIPRPFFAHVRAPNGVQVTRNHPPQASDAQDHRRLHPGIWLAFGDLDEHDYWRLKAPVVHERIDALVTTEPNHGWFVVRNKYLSTSGGSTVCHERCRFDIYVKPTGYLLIWDSQFSVAEKDFYFGDQEEMGLGVRVATPIAVDRKLGGRIVDSEGRRDGAEVWGKQAAWCDYHGTVDGQNAGIMIMPDPANFRASWWHARDYGFVAANPFGANAFTGAAESRVYVRPDEPLRIRFGLLIHGDGLTTDAQRRAAYQEFCAMIAGRE